MNCGVCTSYCVVKGKIACSSLQFSTLTNSENQRETCLLSHRLKLPGIARVSLCAAAVISADTDFLFLRNLLFIFDGKIP